jgi:hypothetical protein
VAQVHIKFRENQPAASKVEMGDKETHSQTDTDSIAISQAHYFLEGGEVGEK